MRRHGSLVRFVAPAIGAALLVAACGSGGESAGGSIDEWCAFAAEAETVDRVFDSLADDPSAIEDGLKQVRVLAERLPKVAPDEVSDDAKALSDGALLVVKSFEDADFNFLDADLSALGDPALEARNEAANASLDAFTQRECGRSFGISDDGGDSTSPAEGTVSDGGDVSDGEGGSDDPTFDPDAGTVREQIVTQLESIGLSNAEATCISEKLDFTDPAVQNGDIASMLDVFELCGIGLDRLAELGQS